MATLNRLSKKMKNQHTQKGMGVDTWSAHPPGCTVFEIRGASVQAFFFVLPTSHFILKQPGLDPFYKLLFYSPPFFSSSDLLFLFLRYFFFADIPLLPCPFSVMFQEILLEEYLKLTASSTSFLRCFFFVFFWVHTPIYAMQMLPLVYLLYATV